MMTSFVGKLRNGAWFQLVVQSAHEIADTAVLSFDATGLSWSCANNSETTVMQVAILRDAWSSFSLAAESGSVQVAVNLKHLFQCIGIARPVKEDALEVAVTSNGDFLCLSTERGDRAASVRLRALDLTRPDIPDLTRWSYDVEVELESSEFRDMLTEVAAVAGKARFATRVGSEGRMHLVVESTEAEEHNQARAEKRLQCDERSMRAVETCSFNLALLMHCAKGYKMHNLVQIAVEPAMPVRVRYDMSDWATFACWVAPLRE